MNFGSFDLNLLRVLDALLREGSTVRAGARIGLSQPAVSAALGRLRAALGDPLFVRHGQRLVPTDFARSLELPLHETLDRIEALLAGPGLFDPRRASDSFRLSGSDFFAEMLMPDLGRHLAGVAPGVRAQLIDLVPENYVGTLERYEVDLALVPSTDLPEWTDSAVLFRSAFAVVARRGHPVLARAGLRPGATIPLDLFCDLGHVLFSPEGRLQAMGDAALAAVGRARRVVMTLPVFAGVARVVAQSDHVALMPVQLAQRYGPLHGLDLYRAPIPVPVATIRMVWHRRMTRAPAHRWFRQTVAAILQPLDAQAALPEAGERP